MAKIRPYLIIFEHQKQKSPFTWVKGLRGRRRPTLPPGVAVPSAQTGLTSLFGMERGVPRRHGHLDLQYLKVHDMTYVGTDLWQGPKKESTKCLFYKGAREGRASLRAISTARLHASLHFHLRPIDVVISHGPLKKSHLVAGFALICLQRLSHPDLATRRCPWRDNRCTSGRSSSVLSY